MVGELVSVPETHGLDDVVLHLVAVGQVAHEADQDVGEGNRLEGPGLDGLHFRGLGHGDLDLGQDDDLSVGEKHAVDGPDNPGEDWGNFLGGGQFFLLGAVEEGGEFVGFFVFEVDRGVL